MLLGTLIRGMRSGYAPSKHDAYPIGGWRLDTTYIHNREGNICGARGIGNPTMDTYNVSMIGAAAKSLYWGDAGCYAPSDMPGGIARVYRLCRAEALRRM